MTDTTTTERVALRSLKPGDTFRHGDREFVLLEHVQTKSVIAGIGGGRIAIYRLAMRALVTPLGRDEPGYRLGLAEYRPPITFTPGDKVRIIDNPRTRRAGAAGKEAIVTSVNSKTISLDNGYRMSPQYIEAV